MRTKLLLFILFFLSFNNISFSEDEVIESVFVVSGIPVFSDSDSLDNAQREGVNKATEEAFLVLLQRMLPASAHWKLETIKKSQAFDLVKEITTFDERKTSHSYMATVNIEFSEEGVRNLLNVLGITYTEQYARPMLVIPMIAEGKEKVIWGNAEWDEAWGIAPSRVGLQRYSYMLGDLEDVGFFKDKDLYKLEHKDFQRLLSKYEAVDVLIIDVSKNNKNFDVVLRILSSLDDMSQTTSYPVDSSLKSYENYALLSNNILNKVDEFFKGIDLFDNKKEYRTRLYVPFLEIKEWKSMKSDLESMAGFKAVDVIKSSTNMVIVDIVYNIEPIEMSTVLAKKGFEITEENNIQYLYKVSK